MPQTFHEDEVGFPFCESENCTLVTFPDDGVKFPVAGERHVRADPRPGGYKGAIVYSLIASCKAADVDPRKWMEDVLVKISVYMKENKDLSELLPRNWKNLLPRK